MPRAFFVMILFIPYPVWYLRSHDRPAASAGTRRRAPAVHRAAGPNPERYKGFAQLTSAAFAPGNLDRSVKELIALAIGVVQGCDGCIASHAHAAVKAGITKQRAAEAIGVTFLMHGGPATIYGARAYTAFREFFDADHG